MYLKTYTDKVKTNSYRLVNYCDDCHSHNIETIHTCKDCGSHNVKMPTTMDLLSDDKLGMEPVYAEVEHKIYRCDICNEEFEYTRINKPTSIYYEYDCFEIGAPEDDGREVVQLEGDVCWKCMQKIVRQLNTELADIATRSHILEIAENISKNTNCGNCE